MKTRYLLFLTSCLCGIAFSFACASYAQVYDGDDDTNLTPKTAASTRPTPTLSDQKALSIATRLVSDRDAALVAHNREALQALTVPDSPARQLDDALFDTVGTVNAINTVVLDVHVLTDNEWKVHSIQQELSTGDGRLSDSGQERCTLWRMKEQPWRLYETGECG